MSRGIFDPRFERLPKSLPLFPLMGALLLPGGQLALNIFEPRYLSMVDHALASSHRMIGMIQPQRAVEKASQRESFEDCDAPLYSIGCSGRISTFAETNDGRYVLSLKGLIRFKRDEEFLNQEGFREASVDYDPFRDDMAEVIDADFDRDRLLRILSEYFSANSIRVDWKSIKQTESERLVNTLAMICPFSPVEKQAILEAPNLSMRADVMEVIMEMSLHQKPDS